MLFIFVALFFFLDAVIVHLMICRRKTEGLFLKLFLGIAFMNLVLVWVVFWFLGRSTTGAHEGFLWMPLYATATAIYVLLIPTYLVFYFSTQQVSPSKKILMLLAQKGTISFNEFLSHFSDQELVLPRIQDLIITGCILEHNGVYVLTPAGVKMARVYQIYQAILGRGKGG